MLDRLAGGDFGVYIHFPWCIEKCPYCDFNSHPLTGNLDEKNYLAALILDLKHQLQIASGDVTSIFFGGGTPSLFSAETFKVLLDIMAPRMRPGCEVTMEANPGATEHGRLADYLNAGINRLSFGGQSFSNKHLHALGRIHTADETTHVVTQARKAGFDNINIDLMYALPEQTPAQALDDLHQALALAPDHLSWYQLTIEAKTEFAKRPPVQPSEDIIETMEYEGRALLNAAGYSRYEVSAYAREVNKRCLHNLTYWRFGDYLGIGAGAHGKITLPNDALITGPALRIQRTHKARQPRLYMKDPLRSESHYIAMDELASEFLMNTLRLTEGVSFSEYETRTGQPLRQIESQWQTLLQMGLVREDRLATTTKGYQHLDSVVAAFL